MGTPFQAISISGKSTQPDVSPHEEHAAREEVRRAVPEVCEEPLACRRIVDDWSLPDARVRARIRRRRKVGPCDALIMARIPGRDDDGENHTWGSLPRRLV